MNKYIPNSILRQIGFIIVFLALFLLILYYLGSFIPGVLGAVCLYVLLEKPLKYLHIEKKWNKTLSILLLMLSTAAIILMPLYFLVSMLVSEVKEQFDQKEIILSELSKAVSYVNTKIKINLLDEKYLQKSAEIGTKGLQFVLNTTSDALIQFAVAFFILFFMLSQYKELEKWLLKNVPLQDDNVKVIGKDFRSMVFANTIGVPVVAILQAIVAYIGYLIFGVDNAFYWFILTIFAAMIPVVGAAIIYIPLVIVLLAEGNNVNAILLLLYCLILVGLVDNVFRFAFSKKFADVHPLITVFGVILGMNLFGFIGIIFGPILFSLLIWMYQLYSLEFRSKERF